MRPTLSILLLAAACGSSKAPAVLPAPVDPPAAAASSEPAAMLPTKPVTNQSLVATGLDPSAIDRAIDPCDDFYQFACGGWIRRTEIAADKAEAMRSFVDIADRNLEYEHGLLERASKQPGDDAGARQLGVYYRSCMDEPAIEKAGLGVLRPQLAAIDKVVDARSLTATLAALHAAGVDALFVLEPIQDAADARNVIAQLDQGGIGLPDRDYYLNDDEATTALRATYQAYVESLLTAIGHPDAARDAAAVVTLETEIAKVSKDKVARRDPHGTYHKVDRAGVARALPHLAWDAYWAGVGLRGVKDVTITSPELLAGLDKLIASTGPDAGTAAGAAGALTWRTWRAYLAVALTHATAPLLTKQLEDQAFKLESALTGQPEMAPRWKRCVQRTEQALGDLIGQAFVRDRFGGASKAAAEDEIHAIVAAMAVNLAALPWMDDATKAKARAKLDAVAFQIGYPRKWRGYALKLDPRTWAANAVAARKLERARQLAKIQKPVDKDDWQITVPDANAYYDPQLNGMVFPAGILQPPLYSPAAAVAVNLGGMGMVVGHELTHGFDDQGVQYDAAGNLVNWWQPATEAAFKDRTRCVIDQYSGYQVAGGTRLDGANTAGENIADIGGVKLAFAAYRALREAAPDTVVADGFTEDQQFFLGFGQVWCSKLRPELERMRATLDVHAPAEWRVNGALSATPEFGQAFRCKPGSKMVPARQCVVW